MFLKNPPFENRMNRTETLLGWLYFPLHVLIFPYLFSLYAAFSPDALTQAQANLVYYCVGIAFVLFVMFRFLRDCFDGFMDRPGYCILTMLTALLLDYGLSYIIMLLLMLVAGNSIDPNAVINPNSTKVMTMATMDYGAVRAIGIFMAPVVEEVLFRGVLFGSVRSRSRVGAYALSILLFSLYHVWQSALAAGDATVLLYAVQYLPISFVLAWVYERTGSIWTAIFFHMGFNAISFYALDLLQTMM